MKFQNKAKDEFERYTLNSKKSKGTLIKRTGSNEKSLTRILFESDNLKIVGRLGEIEEIIENEKELLKLLDILDRRDRKERSNERWYKLILVFLAMVFLIIVILILKTNLDVLSKLIGIMATFLIGMEFKNAMRKKRKWF